MGIGGPIPRWATLLAWGLLGCALISLRHFLPHGPWLQEVTIEVLRDVGIAIVVATFLAFTIDRWFSADLHKDVFEAVLGYIPPPAFKEEIRGLLRYSFVCEKHLLRFVIEEPAPGLVRVTTSTERTLKNITSRPVPMKGYLHMDEWGFEIERSRIIDCYMEIDGRRHDAIEKPQYDSTLLAETKQKLVGPKREAKVYTKCSEIKRNNSELNFNFGAPTINPEILVIAPETIECACSFGPVDPEIETDIAGQKHVLRGTYFPGQRMRVRWWPKVTIA